MFKLKIDLEKGLIQGAGFAVDIATDLLFVVNEIHALLARRDKTSAEVFRKALIVGVDAPDSPLFNGESSPGTSFIIQKGEGEEAKGDENS